MGFFSWNTSDTNRSIASSYSNRPTFEVTLKDNNGNQWHEYNYLGYGVFGGMDIFDLIAIMNGWRREDIDKFNQQQRVGGGGMMATDLRDIGISILNEKDTILPILVEDADIEWSPTLPPEDCEYQGYFYPEDDKQHFSL